MTKTQEQSLISKYENVKNKLEIAQQLVTTDGFHQYWFESLALPENRNKTKAQIFEQVNDLYKEVFNKKIGKYSNYRSFMITIKKNLMDL